MANSDHLIFLEIVLNYLFGMRVNSHRRRRMFCMATAITIALSLVIICLTSQALGQNDINEGDDNALVGGGRARIARLRRLRLRTESTTTTSAPVRERTRVRVKAIKSRKQKVNADRRATLAQSKSNSGISSSSPDDTNNRRNKVNRGEETSRKDAANNGKNVVFIKY